MQDKVFYVRALDTNSRPVHKYYFAKQAQQVERFYKRTFPEQTITTCKEISISNELIEDYKRLYGKHKGGTLCKN